MLRWMLSPITGVGTIENPYRASVLDVSPQPNVAAIIPTILTGPNAGQPKFRFALCLIATSNVSIVGSAANSYVFPDYNLDGRMDGMESGTRTGFVQTVQAYDLDGNGLHIDASHQDGESYREVVTRIGQQLEPAFNINAMNCGEVVT